MAPLSTNAISHFMHPAHKLNHQTTNTPYLCDGCKVPGTGSRFTCTICSFDLHHYCAKCPNRLTSTSHHNHPMSLVVHKSKTNQAESCQICNDAVVGLAYNCKACSFWVHPLCVLTNSQHDRSQHDCSQDDHSQHNNQYRSVPSAPGSFTQGHGRVEQVGIGLATNWIYDQISGDSAGGFFESVVSLFSSK